MILQGYQSTQHFIPEHLSVLVVMLRNTYPSCATDCTNCSVSLLLCLLRFAGKYVLTRGRHRTDKIELLTPFVFKSEFKSF